MRHCEGCADPIPANRLRAVPNARRCVKCQEKYDLSPIEALGYDRVNAGLAVVSEADGDDLRAVLHGQ